MQARGTVKSVDVLGSESKDAARAVEPDGEIVMQAGDVEWSWQSSRQSAATQRNRQKEERGRGKRKEEGIKEDGARNLQMYIRDEGDLDINRKRIQ